MAEEEALKEELEDVTQVDDESEKDLSQKKIIYNITSYGSDPDVSGLIQRLKKGDITIPSFQRAYVWKEEDASSFIESLILGLPVPGIFLASEQKTNKMLVIDGQQRLKSLLFFYDGFFDPQKDARKKKVFKLIDVQPHLDGKTYENLEEKDKRRLDNAIIHATIVKQESPKDGDTSIFHIFHRLNSGGMILKPQEIRRAAFHGTLIEKITELNDYPAWRNIFGKKNRRLKDEELILRFLALFFDIESYRKPMGEFLNTFASKNSKADAVFLMQCEEIFHNTINLVTQSIGEKAFRPKKVINAAVFDSMMVGLAKRNTQGTISDIVGLKESYESLLKDTDYLKAVSDGTSDEPTVAIRLEKTINAFKNLR